MPSEIIKRRYNRKRMATHGTFAIENLLPATFTVPGLSEAEFLELCAQFPDAMVEYTSDGTVIVMPPNDPDDSVWGAAAVCQLLNWAREQGSGRVCGPRVGFRFRDGSRRSPDASWFDSARWRKAKKSGERFPVFAPDFVIEVRSPDDRIRVLRDKMEEYIANGVTLAWLIDPKERTVTIYRNDRAPEILHAPTTVTGEGPVAGFTLNLERVFAG